MKRIVSVILLVFFAMSAWSQESTAPTDSVPDGIFFRISGGGLEKPSYILGTLHTIPGDFVHHIPGFEEAANSVQQFVFESDIAEKTRQMVGTFQSDSIMAHLSDSILFCYDNPDSLHNPYIEDMDSTLYYSILNLKVPDFEMPEFYKFSATKNQQLFLKAYHNSVRKITANMGIPLQKPDFPIDLYIADSIARPRGADIAELDTTAVLINTDSIAAQFIADEKAGKHDRKYYTTVFFPNIMNYYMMLQMVTRQYCDKYFRYEGHSMISPMQNDMEKTLFIERNNLWMQRLPALIQSKPSMVVVGLGHLHDRSSTPGLLSSLMRLGYKIEAIAAPNAGE